MNKNIIRFGALGILVSIYLLLYLLNEKPYIVNASMRVNEPIADFGNVSLEMPSSTESWSPEKKTRSSNDRMKDSNTHRVFNNLGSVEVLKNTSTNRKNVLFLMVDDLRTQIQPYEGKDYLFKQPEMRTPNFRRLAAQSLLLKNAFVQYSLCGPSRTSMLTSRRPDTLLVFDNQRYWRQVAGNYTTLPQYFKEQGYLSICIGKVFHLGESSNDADPMSWSQPCYVPVNNDIIHQPHGRWQAVSEKAMKKLPLIDVLSLKRAETFLESVASEVIGGETNFFLALGIKKPHTAQVCPEKFFKWYTVDNTTKYLSREEENSAKYDDYTLKQFRRGYYACISYVDSLVGMILDILERTNLKDSTVVSFVSDHGYHYGEHGLMGKSKNFDVTTKVPLMVHVPGRTDHGIISDSVVEAIDIFPTIVEAAGLEPVPSCGDNPELELCTEGESFLDLIDNPDLELKGEAYSQRSAKQARQYSIRTDRFRFSQWTRKKGTTGELLVDQNMELYDHDMDHKEYHNVAYQPEYAKVTRVLSARLSQYVRNYR